MSTLLHGVDLVEIARIERLIAEHSSRFLERVYTPGELEHSHGRASRVQHLAARFAAKEAVLKALGTGLDGGITWRDVEVVSEAGGRPTVRLHGEAANVASRHGVVTWVLSLSHTREMAMASVVGSLLDEAGRGMSRPG